MRCGDFLAQAIDVLALLADDDARPGGMHGDHGVMRRTRYLDATDRSLCQPLLDEFTDLQIHVQVVRVFIRTGIPR